MKKKYNLLLSTSTREKLYKQHASSAQERQIRKFGEVHNAMTYRVSLSKLFHGNYIDNRPPILQRLNAWSIAERPWHTQVMLTDEQVAAVLQLALDLNIDPKPSKKVAVMSRKGLVSVLLSSFVEAVVQGHLREIK